MPASAQNVYIGQTVLPLNMKSGSEYYCVTYLRLFYCGALMIVHLQTLRKVSLSFCREIICFPSIYCLVVYCFVLDLSALETCRHSTEQREEKTKKNCTVCAYNLALMVVADDVVTK